MILCQIVLYDEESWDYIFMFYLENAYKNISKL